MMNMKELVRDGKLVIPDLDGWVLVDGATGLYVQRIPVGPHVIVLAISFTEMKCVMVVLRKLDLADATLQRPAKPIAILEFETGGELGAVSGAFAWIDAMVERIVRHDELVNPSELPS